ncbi:hypothetical protein HPB50_011252 [Hyalomma asiaticum]|uniref:Uncharacterized protein n=1 Tax=Hyalomma asiaticum TaxID=266040 RepID=A0ACB7SG33_HYAAI|nr:hypothetical protein HPB50_011252 [Hyalomma asiaticum]
MATLKARDLISDMMKLGNRGPPQAKVISLTHFNISVVGLALGLEDIECTSYTIYAGDVTMWSTGSKDGKIQQRAQLAVNVTEEYVVQMGFRCFSRKRNSYCTDLRDDAADLADGFILVRATKRSIPGAGMLSQGWIPSESWT